MSRVKLILLFLLLELILFGVFYRRSWLTEFSTRVSQRLIRSEVSTNEPELPARRSLLIIQGQYRTFDYCVDSIIENLVKTNAPCDVILSVDAKSQELSTASLTKLRPYLLHILYSEPSDLRVGSIIEFVQVHKALQWLRSNDSAALSRYDYVMKSRTDVYIARPLRFLTALAQDGIFPSA